MSGQPDIAGREREKTGQCEKTVGLLSSCATQLSRSSQVCSGIIQSSFVNSV